MPVIDPIGNEWNPPALPFGALGWNFETIQPDDGQWERLGSEYVAQFIQGGT